MGAVPRKVLAAALRPLLPTGWKIEPSSRVVDNIPATVVQLRQLSIRRLTVAPVAFHEIDFRVTITAPGELQQGVEDRLDDDVLLLIVALDGAHIKWSECQKVIVGSRLGYDITLTITGNKE